MIKVTLPLPVDPDEGIWCKGRGLGSGAQRDGKAEQEGGCG
jgi:hypothetical protein